MEYQKLIADLEQTYYAQVVLLIVELATLITGILYSKKYKIQNTQKKNGVILFIIDFFVYYHFE